MRLRAVSPITGQRIIFESILKVFEKVTKSFECGEQSLHNREFMDIIKTTSQGEFIVTLCENCAKSSSSFWAILLYKIKETSVCPTCCDNSIVSHYISKGSKTVEDYHREVSILRKILERCCDYLSVQSCKSLYQRIRFWFPEKCSCRIHFLVSPGEEYTSLNFKTQIHKMYTDYERFFYSVARCTRLKMMHAIGT